MGRICQTKMWLTLSYRHGNANGFECDEKLRPKTIASSLKKCSKDMYPNLSALLKLAATLHETSCECESFYVLRRLRTWLRASMTTKRLSSLAIINIHREAQIDQKRAVKIFLELHPRKLNVSNLIFDED